jgi:hypothetical protein
MDRQMRDEHCHHILHEIERRDVSELALEHGVGEAFVLNTAIVNGKGGSLM